ncbi:MAG TPA: hypothetical protein VNT75_21785 [Symbiobacteriaceae bacterium]|nr:hypothetical protein [Symbiobacteriaceae bacterium]
MVWSIAVLLGQFALAFLALDLWFRYMDLSSAGMRARIGRHAVRFGAVAAVASLLGGWAQWHLAGVHGLALAAANWVPWWLLWRFGLRKQLTFLFKDDGGRAIDMKKPDL